MKKLNEPIARDMGNSASPRRFAAPLIIGLSLVTLLGGFLYYSQEVRPYALLVLLTVLSYLFFIRQVKNPGWKNSLWYVGVSTLLVYM
jgi:uncharacterized membrane protein